MTRMRKVNVALGAWLVLSAMLWPHTSWQLFNALITGGLIATFALAGLGGWPWGRSINVTLGFWLMTSSVLLPSTRNATIANHLLVGLAVVVVAALPARIEGANAKRWGA
jgi:hypothetical protein